LKSPGSWGYLFRTDQLKDNPTGVSDNASHHRRPTGKTIISTTALTQSMMPTS